MSFFKINQSQIVKNKIKLQPSHTFIYSCEYDPDYPVYKKLKHRNIDSLGINENGYHGRKSVIKSISDDENSVIRYLNSNEENIGHTGIYYLKNSSDIKNSLSSNRIYADQDSNLLISKNLNNLYKFSVERIKKNYLLRDINTDKINYTEKIYEYYNKEKLDHNKNLNWGFTNYNTLNFYSSNNVDKDDSSNLNNFKTHRNMLIYPNFINSNSEQTYNFLKNNSLTISFFINPNKKNKVINNEVYSYNCGNIIFIPGLVSVCLVKGSSIDEFNRTDKYRIVTLFGSQSFKKIPYEDIIQKNNFYSYESGGETKAIISEDNCLSFKNWHNICITINKISNNKYYYRLYIDGVENCKSLVNIDLSSTYKSSINNFLTIGNKPYFIENNLEHDNINNFLKASFSCNEIQNGDYLGSFSKKYINFGEDVSYKEVSIKQSNDWIIYDDTFLNNNNTNNESFALQAEIHDIRIYDVSLDIDRINNIYKNSVSSKEDLIFYVPVYFYPQVVSKKGIVNLHSENNKIKTWDIAYNFPTNPYFFNYTGGTEVSVEHFVTEFVKLANPNIVFGGDIIGDTDYDQYSILNENTIKKYSQKGIDPYNIIVNNISDDSNQNYFDSSNLNNSQSCVYRNLFILPNDNGLQNQNYSFIYENFFRNSNSFLFNTIGEYFNPEIVSMKSYDDKFNLIRFLDESYESINRESNEFNVNYNRIRTKIPLNSFVESDALVHTHDMFDGRRDLYWNISNRNYHSELYSDSAKENEIPYNNTTYGYIDSVLSDSNRSYTSNGGSRISIGESDSFLKTKSNPVTRIYNDSLSNSIDTNHIIYSKKIDDNQTKNYYRFEMPLYKLSLEKKEHSSVVFAISNQLFNNEIARDSFNIYDVDYPGSLGVVRLDFKDSGYSCLYRNNCLTKVANWNKVGNILYEEGLVSILHPGASLLGYTNYRMDFDYKTSLFVHEVNLDAMEGFVNKTRNDSYINDLKLDNSSFNKDEDFVYITDINLHDENLNIIAKAKMANPVPKKNSDNITFRLKMDF